MRGRDFLTIARDAYRRGTEAYWRTAVGRAYYAAMLEIRDAFTRWGLSVAPPPVVHDTVRRRLYTSKDADMKLIGQMLDRLRALRRLADYETTQLRQFASSTAAMTAVKESEDALAIFDAIDGDVPRRSVVLAEIRSVLP